LPTAAANSSCVKPRLLRIAARRRPMVVCIPSSVPSIPIVHPRAVVGLSFPRNAQQMFFLKECFCRIIARKGGLRAPMKAQIKFGF
jgi:hypothetical protein